MATVSTENLLLTLQVDAREATEGLGDLEDQTKKTQQAFKTVGNNTKQFNAAIQNSSYQIADFAVQVGGGVSALKAFSQQAPQLLSGFGYIGAAAGAVVAVLAAGANSLFNFADSSKQAANALEDFENSLSSMTGSGGTLTKFAEALKEANEEQKELILVNTKLTKAALAESLDKSTAAFYEQIEAAKKWNNTVTGGFINFAAAYDELDALQRNLGVNEQAAEQINNLFKAFEDGSKSVDAIVTGLKQLKLAGEISADAVDPLIKALEKVGEDSKALSSLSELLESFEDLSQPFDEMADGIKATGDAAYEAMTPLQDYWEELQKYADTVRRAQDPTIEMIEKITLLKDAYKAKLLTLEQYNKEMGNITALKKRTTALQDALDTFDKEILGIGKGEEITSLLEDLQTEAAGWADQFANTLVSGLSEGKLAFKDFANYVLEQLARIAISKAFEPLFQGFGDWIGSLGPASAPVAAGLIATPVNDLPLFREASSAQQMIVGVPRLTAPSPSSSPVTVNVMNYGSDDVEVNERKTSRGIEVDVLIKNTVKQGLASGDFDKVMATSFGTRRLAY